MRYMILLAMILAFAGLARADAAAAADSDAMAWRWNARVVDFVPSCNAARNEFDTPESIERRVLELKGMGNDVIVLNGLHTRVALGNHEPMLLRVDKMICDIAHSHGMKVIEHHDLTISPYVDESGYGMKLALANFDWYQRDIQYGHVIQNFCFNNPGFTRHYLDMLVRYVRATDCDGLLLDEVGFGGGMACGCPHCRAKFKADTGLELPDDDMDAFFEHRGDGPYAQLRNGDDRRLVQWLTWRARAIADWRENMRRVVRRVKPDFTFMVYTTNHGLVSPAALRGSGANIFDSARACDWLGTELMTRNVFACPRAVFHSRKLFRALGEWTGSPIYSMVYHANDPDIAKLGWAMMAMSREMPYMIAIDGQDMSYIGWQGKMDNRNARSMADVVFLFSIGTRNWNRMMAFLEDFGGYSQTFSDAHIQHDVLLEPRMTPEILRRYKLLVVASMSCMSDELAATIREYVRGGGRLLISGHASLLDELGFPRKDFALADVMNVHHAGLAPEGARLRMEGRDYALAYRSIGVTVADPARATVRARLVDAQGKDLGPAMVESRFGKGLVVYDAARMGMYDYEREVTAGRKFDYNRDPALHGLLQSFSKRVCGDGLRFKADDMPEKVFVTVYRQEVNGSKQVVVNLLNATGSHSEHGAVVPHNAPKPAWPALTEDLAFRIRLNACNGGYVASPDFPERRPVRIARDGGWWRVTVSKADVATFSTVYLDVED